MHAGTPPEEPKGHPIHIYTDSQGALKTLKGHKFTTMLALECRDKLQQLASSNPVTVSWVPGHQGIEGNEIADRLAREG